MDEDNVGASLYRKNIYIVNSGATIARMVPTLQRMAALGLKLARREAIGKPEDEGYLARGIKRNEFAAKPPAERAVDMLLAKLRGEEYHSEIAPPKFAGSKPAAPLGDLKSAVIALVTDGGLVIEGNPDNIEPGRPTRFTTIPISGVNSLAADKYDAVHSGYDTAFANQDPNRLVPLDTMRELEREGVIGKVHEFVHSTGGAHAAVENATQIGREIAAAVKSSRRHRRDPHLDLRLQHSLRRSDQQRNRKAGNPGDANLHDDPRGQGSRLAARHRLRRHRQPDWQSRTVAGQGKRIPPGIGSARSENFAGGSVKRKTRLTRTRQSPSKAQNISRKTQRRKYKTTKTCHVPKP